jgi:hypothetical protein
MKAKELYFKTMPFVWAKLLLALVTVAISAVLLGVLLGIGWLLKSWGVTFFMFLIWLGLVNVVRFIVMHYFGYLVKAGHIAVMAEAVTTGRVPDNQVAYGKRMVMERFATSNVYFAIDKLVAAAVKQIQRVVGKLGKTLNFVPGMNTVTGLAQFFVELSLGYVDECCLGYTFYKREQGAFKSAADAVAIYAQNWKKLLGSAAKTMAMVIVGIVVITLALFIVFGVLVRLLSLPDGAGLAAFLLALLIAMAVKYAFMDSFVLARTMVAYMEDAPTTTIQFDLYGKLCNMSSKFKELWNKGQQEQPGSQPVPQPAYAAAGGTPAAAGPVAATDEKPAFCGQCGAKNQRGVKFCGSCGAKMQ